MGWFTNELSQQRRNDLTMVQMNWKGFNALSFEFSSSRNVSGKHHGPCQSCLCTPSETTRLDTFKMCLFPLKVLQKSANGRTAFPIHTCLTISCVLEREARMECNPNTTTPGNNNTQFMISSFLHFAQSVPICKLSMVRLM